MRKRAKTEPLVDTKWTQMTTAAALELAERKEKEKERRLMRLALLEMPMSRVYKMMAWAAVLMTLSEILISKMFVHSLVAHDCSAEGTTSFPLDLSDTEPCPRPEMDYKDSEKIELQVMRINGPLSVEAGVCEATIRKKVTRCGWRLSSNSAMVSVPRSPVLIDEKQCWHMIRTGEFIHDGRSFRLERGFRQAFAYFPHGGADEAGNCEHVPMLHSGGKTYAWHYEEAELSVKYDKVTALLDVNKGMVRFSNGLKMSEESSTLFDQDKGRIVWRRRQLKQCTDDMSEIYRGPADFHKYIGQQADTPLRKRRVAPSEEKSVALVTGETKLESVHRMGLYYGQGTLKCGRHCHHVVNLPNFIVCHYDYGIPQFPNATFRPEAMSELQLTQTDAKVLSDMQHMTTAFRTKAKFEAVIDQQCRAELRGKKTKLAAVTTGSP